jgi:hypothetical protein
MFARRYQIAVLGTGVLIALSGCASKPVLLPTRTPAEIEAMRVARRANAVSIADSHFLSGNLKTASDAYLAGANDIDLSIRVLAKRKLATVYELQGNAKGAITLLNEVTKEKESPISTDPLTFLKTLYLAERAKDEASKAKAVNEGALAQLRAFEVTHDPLIEPSKPQNFYYWLAMESAGVTDWILFDWAIERAEKQGSLSNQQTMQVALVLAPKFPDRSKAILKALEPKLSPEDKQQEAATRQKIQETDEVRKTDSVKKEGMSFDVETLPYVVKFKETGYWITGMIPKFKLFKMRMGSPR